MDIFCKIIEGEIPSNTCFESDLVECIMDVNPLRPGHTLIIPKKHYETILDMDEEILSEVNKIAKELIVKMEDSIPGINGVQVLVNYGEPQKVKHYHMHLIPTYEKDSNLSQEEICELLKK